MQCDLCAATTCPSGFVPLWDGRTYCAQCVEKVSPHLLEHAREHPVLEETLPDSAWKVAVHLVLCFTVGLSAVWLVFPLVLLVGGKADFIKSLQLWGGLSCLGMPLVVLFASAHAIAFAARRPTVSASGGRIVCKYGKQETSAPMGECQWYDGDASHMTVLQRVIVLPRPALVIVFPHVEGELVPRRVAVGFDPQTRDVWEALLRISRMPLQTPWTQRPGFPLIAQGAFIGLAFSVGFVGFMFLGRLVADLLGLFIPDRSLGLIVGTLVFVCGFLTAMLYAFIVGLSRGGRFVPTKRSQKDQFRWRLNFTAIFLLVAAFFILPMPIGIPNPFNLTPLARLVGTALTCVWALVVAWDIGRRISRYDYAFARPADENSAGSPPLDVDRDR